MTKKIYTRKLAIYLRNKGFKIVGIECNPYKPEFDVWLFEDTPELGEAMCDYQK